MNAVHDAKRLAELQALPLERKIQITQTRIIEWYEHYNGQVCVSFSGGKDSTVLLHIARRLYPDIPAVFSNTGLEFSEIQRFVKTWENVDIIVPKMRFDEVVSTYGYPLIGKEVAERIFYARKMSAVDERMNDVRRKMILGTYMRPDGKGKSAYCIEKWLPLSRLHILIGSKCCCVMKKSPMHSYESKHKRRPIVATLAEESRQRRSAWIMHGCNSFAGKHALSQPMAFWTEQDVLTYIVKHGLKIASVYGEIVSIGDDGNEYPTTDVLGNELGNLRCTGCQRTGCTFCAFGMHRETGKTRFQLLAELEPRKYEYAIGGGAMGG